MGHNRLRFYMERSCGKHMSVCAVYTINMRVHTLVNTQHGLLITVRCLFTLLLYSVCLCIISFKADLNLKSLTSEVGRHLESFTLLIWTSRINARENVLVLNNSSGVDPWFSGGGGDANVRFCQSNHMKSRNSGGWGHLGRPQIRQCQFYFSKEKIFLFL